MLKRITLGAAMLATAMLPCEAFGLSRADTANPAYTPEFGVARPPIGFVRFCAENPRECKKPASSKRLAMNSERWNLLYQVNTYINGRIMPVSDMELYGEAERWTFPIDAGDCEDYLLLKKRTLEELGFPSAALLITVVLDENKEGHAILTIATDQGDYVLDNRRNDITRWRDTNYTFLKRQSQSDPRAWVALLKEKSIATGTVGTSNAH